MSAGTADADFAAVEAAVERAFGARLRSDEAACSEMWSALANVRWRRADGDEVAYSLRHASQLISYLRGQGHDLEWCCSGPLAAVGDEMEAAMAREGWTPEPRAD